MHFAIPQNIKHFQFDSFHRIYEIKKYIQGVPGGKVNILGGHTICHSKQKKCTGLFITVSETELFHCTVSKLLMRKRYYILFLILVFIVQVTKFV
jgi:hypothetical protein